MGIRSWLKRVIPDEWSVKDIAAAAGAAYFGYKGLTSTGMKNIYSSTYSSAKGFIGQPAMTSAPYAEGTGLYGWVDKTATKYPKTSDFITGFGKQVAGKALKGEDEAEARARIAAEQARITRMMKTKQYNIPGGVPMQNVGTFQASRAAVPGFKNAQVNESLNLMAYFMQDLRDNGRIDSSALYAESTRGTTIKLPKTMKMSI